MPTLVFKNYSSSESDLEGPSRLTEAWLVGCVKIGKLFLLSKLLWSRIAMFFDFISFIILVVLVLLDKLVATYLVVIDYQLYNVDRFPD
jgi:hypothetical protein